MLIFVVSQSSKLSKKEGKLKFPIRCGYVVLHISHACVAPVMFRIDKNVLDHQLSFWTSIETFFSLKSFFLAPVKVSSFGTLFTCPIQATKLFLSIDDSLDFNLMLHLNQLTSKAKKLFYLRKIYFSFPYCFSSSRSSSNRETFAVFFEVCLVWFLCVLLLYLSVESTFSGFSVNFKQITTIKCW